MGSPCWRGVYINGQHDAPSQRSAGRVSRLGVRMCFYFFRELYVMSSTAAFTVPPGVPDVDSISGLAALNFIFFIFLLPLSDGGAYLASHHQGSYCRGTCWFLNAAMLQGKKKTKTKHMRWKSVKKETWRENIAAMSQLLPTFLSRWWMNCNHYTVKDAAALWWRSQTENWEKNNAAEDETNWVYISADTKCAVYSFWNGPWDFLLIDSTLFSRRFVHLSLFFFCFLVCFLHLSALKRCCC